MRRFMLLTFSLLIFTVTFVRADEVVVQVGGGHRGGYHHGYHHGHGGFVYRSYWHHRGHGWGHVYLAPQFSVYLGPLPYNGPGYQIVTVYFADGSSIGNVYVYNHDQIELPPAYAGKTITQIVVQN